MSDSKWTTMFNRKDIAFQELCNAFPLRPIESNDQFQRALVAFKNVNDYFHQCPEDAFHIRSEIQRYLDSLLNLIEEFGNPRGLILANQIHKIENQPTNPVVH